MKLETTIEVGHTFKLGTKYSKDLNATFLDKAGKEKLCIMGCYGIGVNRIIAAAIEQNNDKDGIIWPAAISPYQLSIIEVDSEDPETRKVSESLYKSLIDDKLEVLLDDRKERTGIKFKDADLIGIPIQIIIGHKNLKKKSVEVKIRKDGKRILYPIKDALPRIKKLLA